MHWLSYGGGVNSTALAILLADGKLPQYMPWKSIFADTKAERPETYAYIERFTKWLAERGIELITVVGGPENKGEPVIERWKRLNVTGSRLIRACTDKAKIKPIEHYIKTQCNDESMRLIGIAADESHRVRDDPKQCYPLVDLGIDRAGCVEIIRAAGLCVPVKSGCWCCPFLRVGEILELARDPERSAVVVELEHKATAQHRPEGPPCYQFGDHPMEWWIERAKREDAANAAQGSFDDWREPNDDDIPCGCVD